MPTTVVKTIGSGARDYSTIPAWNTAAPANLVTADQIWEGDCYNDSEFVVTSAIVISGSTSDATRYKRLTTGAGQSFADNTNKLTNSPKYNQANGVGIRCATNYQALLTLSENYARADKLQLSHTAGTNATSWCAQINNTGNLFQNIIAEYSGSSGYVISHNNSNGVLVNCIAVSRASGSCSGVNMHYPASGSGVFNCTVVRPSDLGTSGSGIANDSTANPVIKNCAVFGPFTNRFSGSFNASSDYNATDAGTATGGAHDLTSLTYASQFQVVTDASRDFRTKVGGLDTKGTRDQTNTNDLDIVGQTRSTTAPTIGAWEVVSVSPALTGSASTSGIGTEAPVTTIALRERLQDRQKRRFYSFPSGLLVPV